jgi:hypothetical protein
LDGQVGMEGVGCEKESGHGAGGDLRGGGGKGGGLREGEWEGGCVRERAQDCERERIGGYGST